VGIPSEALTTISPYHNITASYCTFLLFIFPLSLCMKTYIFCTEKRKNATHLTIISMLLIHLKTRWEVSSA